MMFADVAYRAYQARLAEALDLDPGTTTEVAVSRIEARVYWTRTLEGLDLDQYDHFHLSSESPVATVGLTMGRHFSYEQWDKVVDIDEEWRSQFPKVEGA